MCLLWWRKDSQRAALLSSFPGQPVIFDGVEPSRYAAVVFELCSPFDRNLVDKLLSMPLPLRRMLLLSMLNRWLLVPGPRAL